MRVLWFTNGALPPALIRQGLAPAGSGQWMTCLLDHMVRAGGVEIDVATAHPGLRDDEFSEGGVRYVVFGQPRYESIFEARRRDIERCVRLVENTNPDLVHIHGSERFFGLLAARGLIRPPALISIQGLVDACLPIFFGSLSAREIWQSEALVEIATRRGLLWRYRDYSKGAELGREILANGKAFMGRTEWDRAHLRSANPSAVYYYGGEILRPQFSGPRWDLDSCDRYSVIFTNAGSEPRRGVEVLVDAMQVVRREFPEAELRLAGTLGERRAYDRFLRRRIADAGLEKSIHYLGYLNAAQMAEQLRRAHVFVQPSFMENSSNSLCEAMQSGLPCVATHAGGIPSLIDHGRTGLMIPPGDAPLLAESIAKIFRDRDLAVHLGRSARAEASQRHQPDRVVAQVMYAYRDLTGAAPASGPNLQGKNFQHVSYTESR